MGSLAAAPTLAEGEAADAEAVAGRRPRPTPLLGRAGHSSLVVEEEAAGGSDGAASSFGPAAERAGLGGWCAPSAAVGASADAELLLGVVGEATGSNGATRRSGLSAADERAGLAGWSAPSAAEGASAVAGLLWEVFVEEVEEEEDAIVWPFGFGFSSWAGRQGWNDERRVLKGMWQAAGGYRRLHECLGLAIGIRQAGSGSSWPPCRCMCYA